MNVFAACALSAVLVGFALEPAAIRAQTSPAVVPSSMATPTPLPTVPPSRIGGSVSSIRAIGGFVGGMPIAVPPNAETVPTITVQGAGIATRVPDRVSMNVSISATSQSGVDAVAAITPPVVELQKALERIHGVRVSETNMNVSGYAFQNNALSYNGGVQLEVTLDDLANLASVRAAVGSTPGATINSLRYDVRDRAGAMSEAITAALADARKQLEAIEAKTNLHVGRERSVQANAYNADGADPTVVRIDVRASVVYEIVTP